MPYHVFIQTVPEGGSGVAFKHLFLFSRPIIQHRATQLCIIQVLSADVLRANELDERR